MNNRRAVAAIFRHEDDPKIISLDMQALGMIEGIIRLMQKIGLIKSRFSADDIAFNLYSVIVFQFMGYVFLTEMTEGQLLDSISKQLELVFEGIGG